ncbi:MAG: CIA30 family protein [Litorimonas sp.]
MRETGTDARPGHWSGMIRITAIAVILLSACTAADATEIRPENRMTETTQTDTDPKTDIESQTATPTCRLSADFSDPASLEPWRIVNDGVMGGLSQGTRFHEGEKGNGAMVFAGTINTNGGGFSSLRAGLAPGALSDTEGLRLRVRSDGRAYKMTFRTSERWRGRSVSYQTPIPQTSPGDWAEVTVPFDAMDTSVFGRTVRAAPFDPADAREIGIILADGIDGPFRLEVAYMACRDAHT